ncbi:hypothetical protein ACVU7I_07350 [Patulibacter sp. S7RM1-6]
MKRALLLGVIVVVAAVALWPRGESAPGPGRPAVAAPPVAASVPGPAAVAEVNRQSELPPARQRRERRRVVRMRLLELTRTRTRQMRGVTVLAGNAPDAVGDPQEMWVTAPPSTTRRAATAAVRDLCRTVGDPCRRRDYRFVLRTSPRARRLPIDLDAKDRF